MKQPASVPYEDILHDSLKDKNEAAAYLEYNLDAGSRFYFLIALGNIVKANGGILALSRKTGLSRPNLYRMLSPKGNPEMMSLNKVLRALGLGLSVKRLKGRKTKEGRKKKEDGRKA